MNDPLPCEILECVRWARQEARMRVVAQDVDDCVQEALLRVMRLASNVASQVADWRPYVRAVTRNVCSQRRRETVIQIDASGELDRQPQPGVEWATRRALLLQILSEVSAVLGPRDRRVVREILRASTMAEVGRETGLAPIQVRRAIARIAWVVRNVARPNILDTENCSPRDSS